MYFRSYNTPSPCPFLWLTSWCRCSLHILITNITKILVNDWVINIVIYYLSQHFPKLHTRTLSFITDDGRVHKIVQWYNANGETFSKLLDIFDITPSEPIQVMEISKKHKILYVASDYRVKQVDLVMCNRRYDNCLRCVHDPYCGWEKDNDNCRPYAPGYVSTILFTLELCSLNVFLDCCKMWLTRLQIFVTALWWSVKWLLRGDKAFISVVFWRCQPY